MITRIRKIMGWPFSILAITLFVVALVMGTIGCVICYGMEVTLARLEKVKVTLENLKEGK